MRIAASLACCIVVVLGTGKATAQVRQYTWSDIDCRQSRIVAWPGLKCRATNVVTGEGNIGVFRQWAGIGTSRDGYYAHLFLWEAQNGFSYLSADETTADFVKWIFEYGKSIAQADDRGHRGYHPLPQPSDTHAGLPPRGGRRRVRLGHPNAGMPCGQRQEVGAAALHYSSRFSAQPLCKLPMGVIFQPKREEAHRPRIKQTKS